MHDKFRRVSKRSTNHRPPPVPQPLVALLYPYYLHVAVCSRAQNSHVTHRSTRHSSLFHSLTRARAPSLTRQHNVGKPNVHTEKS